MHIQLFMQMDASDVYMSYLPLAHIFDRALEELFIYNGGSIGFWRGVQEFIRINLT
jgi:long-subunit acyl-CoA synthetase (AMP-forming)